jgi:hypothetical protein
MRVDAAAARSPTARHFTNSPHLSTPCPHCMHTTQSHTHVHSPPSPTDPDTADPLSLHREGSTGLSPIETIKQRGSSGSDIVRSAYWGNLALATCTIMRQRGEGCSPCDYTLSPLRARKHLITCSKSVTLRSPLLPASSAGNTRPMAVEALPASSRARSWAVATLRCHSHESFKPLMC